MDVIMPTKQNILHALIQISQALSFIILFFAGTQFLYA